MIWKKDPKMHYTDMCIYIDENVQKIAVPGENPEVEDLIYNYLWLLVKALAIKKCMFQNFKDYDPFAFYSATRLFFALRKNLANQGKVIKGKEIKPIKSCLNYTKALLYPMRIEYQKEAYREIISEEFVTKKFDAFNYKEHLKSEARYGQGIEATFSNYLFSSLKATNVLLDNVLVKSPFNKNSLDYKRLKMSIMLNCIQSMKSKNKLDMNPNSVILWHFPKSMSSYVKIILKEFYSEIKKEIMDCYACADVDDGTIEKILASAETELLNRNDEE